MEIFYCPIVENMFDICYTNIPSIAHSKIQNNTELENYEDNTLRRFTFGF